MANIFSKIINIFSKQKSEPQPELIFEPYKTYALEWIAYLKENEYSIKSIIYCNLQGLRIFYDNIEQKQKIIDLITPLMNDKKYEVWLNESKSIISHHELQFRCNYMYSYPLTKEFVEKSISLLGYKMKIINN